LKGAILMSGIALRGESAVFRGGRNLAAMWRLMAVVALISGCATFTKDSPVAEKLALATEQAQARWELIIKGDPGAAYDRFMSQGSRQVISRADFVATMKRTAFRTAKVEQVECPGESCKVTVRITYDYQQRKGVEMKGVGLSVAENWIIEDGRLWYVWSQ
jgi:hypothetical protein